MNPKRGKVYRTEELAKYDGKPARLVASLVKKGLLIRLRRGLFYAPKRGAVGEVPPSEAALLKGYFGAKPYLRSGPSVWNALGLGTTAVESVPLVYNTTKTGLERLGEKQGIQSPAAMTESPCQRPLHIFQIGSSPPQVLEKINEFEFRRVKFPRKVDREYLVGFSNEPRTMAAEPP